MSEMTANDTGTMQKNATVQRTGISRSTPPSRYVGPAEARQILKLRRQNLGQAEAPESPFDVTGAP